MATTLLGSRRAGMHKTTLALVADRKNYKELKHIEKGNDSIYNIE